MGGPHDVRFTPVSDRIADIAGGPFRAKTDISFDGHPVKTRLELTLIRGRELWVGLHAMVEERPVRVALEKKRRAPPSPQRAPALHHFIFYGMGAFFRGYVVPDMQRALGDAIERFKKMEISLAHFVAPVGAFSASLLGGRYGNFALTVLAITLLIAAIGSALQRHWCFSDLVAEPDRVKPLDMKGRWIGFALFSLIAAAYCSFVVWRIV